MLDKIIREFSNAVYQVPSRIRQLKAIEPDAVVQAAGATKAQKLPAQHEVRYEAGWITSRRAVLILTGEKLICGNWEIPLSEISTATLLRVRTMLTRAHVLKISTVQDEHYQFGLQYDPAWENQTALQLTVTDGRIKYTPFSIALRIMGVFTWIIILGAYCWLLYSCMAS